MAVTNSAVKQQHSGTGFEFVINGFATNDVEVCFDLSVDAGLH